MRVVVARGFRHEGSSTRGFRRYGQELVVARGCRVASTRGFRRYAAGDGGGKGLQT